MADHLIRHVGISVFVEWDCPCGKRMAVRTGAFGPNREHPADAHLPVYSAHPQCPACGRMHDVYFGVQVVAQGDATDRVGDKAND